MQHFIVTRYAIVWQLLFNLPFFWILVLCLFFAPSQILCQLNAPCNILHDVLYCLFFIYCAGRKIHFFQSFTDRFFVVVLLPDTGRMSLDRGRREAWHTHAHQLTSIVQSVVNICFTTLFALGEICNHFLCSKTDVRSKCV